MINKQLPKTGISKTIALMFCLCLVLNIAAQTESDSTFIRVYLPTTATHPNWYFLPSNQTWAANVVEKYDSNYALQLVSIFHTPPPEFLYHQSPVLSYSRTGQYLDICFGPIDLDEDEMLIPGSYSHIIRDGMGGYVARYDHESCLYQLDSDFQFVDYIAPVDDSGHHYCTNRDVIADDNGYITACTPDVTVSKLGPDFSVLWTIYLPANLFLSMKKLSDGAFLTLLWGNNHYQAVKFSGTGEMIWSKQLECAAVQDFIEINNRYYGIVYETLDINNAELRVYDFGVNFEQEDPGEPILVMPTYPLLDHSNFGYCKTFSVIRTSDNCIVLAVSTPTGEIFKFDSNFNLLWKCNALENERIGIGAHPLIELADGDLLYCATLPSPQQHQVAIVRIDSNGNYVSIDPTELTPDVPGISAYPNPFKSELVIETKGTTNQSNKLEIYNVRGQLVDSMTIHENKATWIPQGLPSGIYVLKLSDNAKQIESKMITYIK